MIKHVHNLMMLGENEGGAETLEIVFGMIVSVGLGVALMSFQGTLRTAIENAGTSVASLFNSTAVTVPSTVS